MDWTNHGLQRAVSPWPHRLAVVLACTTFPLIWVGSLVTTYQAGMAVEDWPTTYGYNLFLYPWQTWIYGPFDLFIEHGHRLLGAAAGMVAMGLVIVCWWCEPRRVVRWAALGGLALVIVQGVLGGFRVLRDARSLAMVHGCVGPAFFAYSIALVTVTSSWWRRVGELKQAAGPGSDQLSSTARWAVLTALFLYTQIVLGARLRHISVMAEPAEFRWAVWFHLAGAAVVALHAVMLWWSSRGMAVGVGVRGLATLLLLLTVVQLTLGGSVWVLKYGWPLGLADHYRWAARTTLVAQNMLSSWIITAHVATGSLLLAVGVLVGLRSWRIHRLAHCTVAGCT